MKNEVNNSGTKWVKYGVWDILKKDFQFGIAEDSPILAEEKLARIVGDPAKSMKFLIRELPYKIVDQRIRYLAEQIRSAGRMVAKDNINKDFLLEGRYYDTIYVTSDSGYESITIGDPSYDSQRGYMLLYTHNTSERDSFPSVFSLKELLWKVVKKEMLEVGEGKAAYYQWDKYPPIEKQLEYFANVVLRVAEVLYAMKQFGNDTRS